MFKTGYSKVPLLKRGILQSPVLVEPKSRFTSISGRKVSIRKETFVALMSNSRQENRTNHHYHHYYRYDQVLAVSILAQSRSSIAPSLLLNLGVCVGSMVGTLDKLKRALVSLMLSLAQAYNSTVHVTRESTDKEVESAYRQLSRHVHPDKRRRSTGTRRV